ncbi:MAG: hypothetical protein Q8755_02915, partial [Candidatus Phytoplasma australasiaticum]|nr:hypothetical protein [Candidatus Phytoplasma australasiaticum]
NLVDYLLKVETLVTKDVKEIYLTGKLSWFDQEKNSNLDFPDAKWRSGELDNWEIREGTYPLVV